MNIRKTYRGDLVWLLLLLVIAGIFRLYKINTPLIEFHSWRQADTVAVSRNFTREGIDLLHPRYDDVSPQQSGLNNPQGYRMVEFPLYNAVIAIVKMIAPAVDIVIWGRVISIAESLIILMCIYIIARREAGTIAAVIASLVFAVYPFFVFYTRAILPETMALMWAMIAMTALYFRRTPRVIALSLICFSLGVLVKPTAVFYAVAILYLLLRRERLTVSSVVLSLGGIALSLLPFGLWRAHISGYPEGIPVSTWLFTHVSTGNGMYSIWFRPSFFRWIFYERLNILILGAFNFVLFVNGLLAKTHTIFPLMILASAMLYVFTFQGGNVQHEYYQIMILPVIALMCGLGAAQLVRSARDWRYRYTALALVILAFSSGWVMSWEKVHHYYYSLSDIPKFAKIVQTLTSPQDRIIVDTAGDTTALYAFDRKGSPGIYADLAQMKRDGGYTYLFTYNHQTADSLEKEDPTITRIFENDRFVLFKL